MLNGCFIGVIFGWNFGGNSLVVFSSYDLVSGVREKFVRSSGSVDAKCVKGMNSRAVAKKRVSKVGFLFER